MAMAALRCPLHSAMANCTHTMVSVMKVLEVILLKIILIHMRREVIPQITIMREGCKVVILLITIKREGCTLCQDTMTRVLILCR